MDEKLNKRRVDLSLAAARWAGASLQREAADEAMERHAIDLEAAAHARCKATHRYSRSGSYPALEKIEDDGSFRFRVSNGRDTGDDFHVVFTMDELVTDPAQVASAFEASQREQAQAQAREELKVAQRKARALGVTDA